MTDLEALARLIEQVTGNVIPEREMDRLGRVASERAAASGQGDVGRYVRFLADRGAEDEWRALLGHVTVNESYLYRGAQQLQALGRDVIPGLAARHGRDGLRVWSAGCARGEEPVSLAMVLWEILGGGPVPWSVLGTDVDLNILDEARLGRFGERAVARLEPRLLERYFRPEGNRYRVVDRLMDRITFLPLNLVNDTTTPPGAPFHVVFLRNVLIYFNPTAQRRVVKRIARLLTDDGVVFVGPGESLWQLRTGLEPRDLGDCFCYRLPTAGDVDPDPKPRVPWSGDRRRDVRRPGISAEGAPDTEPSAASDRVDRTASEVISELAELAAYEDPVTLVPMVVEACRLTPDDATLRAVEGHLLDRAGETRRAVGALRAALYLDPRSCVVRYLLARCLFRLGRVGRARRELRAVLARVSSNRCTDAPELKMFELPQPGELEALSRKLIEDMADRSG